MAPSDGFPYPDENTPGNFAYKPKASDSPNRPRPYNLEDEAERARLLRETLGYAQTSLHNKDGTDLVGREFAHDALKHALMLGYRLVPPG